MVLKNGEYQKCLLAGTHWIGLFEKVEIFDQSKPFAPELNLKVLLKDSFLAEQLDIVEVADPEIAMVYQDENFQYVLPPGQYAYWKGLHEWNFIKFDLSKPEITEDIPLNTRIQSSLAAFLRTFDVQSFQKGLLFKNGSFEKELAPGTYQFWQNPIKVEVKLADMRQQALDVLGQEILTKDKANLRLNFNTVFRIVDIQKALIENNGYEKQLYTAIQLALREYVGTLTLDELLEKKESASEVVMQALEKRLKI